MRSVTSRLSERPGLADEGAVTAGRKLSQLYGDYEQLQDAVSQAGPPDPQARTAAGPRGS